MRGNHGRQVLASLSVVAFGLLAGCAEPVDTTKVTYDRTTVPAAEANAGNNGNSGSTGEPKSNDEAFTNDKLRVLDPCGLLTDDILSAVGTPAENNPSDLSSCGNYMEDADGKELNVTVYVGESVSGSEAADLNIGGLPAIEQEGSDGESCFVTVVTSTSPNFGIKVQTGGEADDLCAPARTVLTSVVDLIREDPPTFDIEQGSVIDVDPCEVLDDATVETALGGPADKSPYNVHWCSWSGDGISLDLWLRSGYDPKDSSGEAEPVDLGGGVTGYQEATTSSGASCRLEWLHRATDAEDQAEIVTLYLDKYEPAEGDNGCPDAQEVAKLVIAALPKP